MRRFSCFIVAMAIAACAKSGARAPQGGPAETRSALLPASLSPSLEASFARWEQSGPSGDPAHRERLEQLATAIQGRMKETGQADILFVCTHNSRRSHMAQLLGLAAARRKGLATVHTFSGGTEATAFNPRAIAALRRVGFDISGGDGQNPHYSVRIGPSLDPAEAFSKRITDPPNPVSGFIVVMTCSQADAACPLVKGAVSRVAIPYEDPKSADGTPEETGRYDERIDQIGRDLTWVFAAVAHRSP
jgi:arsenate reductase